MAVPLLDVIKKISNFRIGGTNLNLDMAMFATELAILADAANGHDEQRVNYPPNIQVLLQGDVVQVQIGGVQRAAFRLEGDQLVYEGVGESTIIIDGHERVLGTVERLPLSNFEETDIPDIDDTPTTPGMDVSALITDDDTAVGLRVPVVPTYVREADDIVRSAMVAQGYASLKGDHVDDHSVSLKGTDNTRHFNEEAGFRAEVPKGRSGREFVEEAFGVGHDASDELNASFGGTTATIAHISTDDKLTVGHLGDSPALLMHKGRCRCIP